MRAGFASGGFCRQKSKTPRCAFGSRPPYQGAKAMNAVLRGLGAVLVLSAAAFFMGEYHNDVYRKLLLWVTLALGYNFLFGICGQVAFSHFAFYGIGAYSVVIFLFQVHMPFPL